MNTGIDEQYLTPKQLATRWGCTTSHLANMRWLGRGVRYVRFGGQMIRYPIDAVREFEQARTIEPTPSTSSRRSPGLARLDRDTRLDAEGTA